MSDDNGHRSSPWHLKLLALAVTLLYGLAWWLAALWWYVERFQ